jgi:hypothetical protein
VSGAHSPIGLQHSSNTPSSLLGPAHLDILVKFGRTKKAIDSPQLTVGSSVYAILALNMRVSSLPEDSLSGKCKRMVGEALQAHHYTDVGGRTAKNLSYAHQVLAAKAA